MAGSSDEFAQDRHDRLDRRLAAAARAFLSPFAGRNARIVGFGADAGWIDLLSSLGADAAFFEIDRRKIDELGGGAASVEKRDFLTATRRIAERSCDIVFVGADALDMSLQDARALLAAILARLAPGGLLLVHARRESGPQFVRTIFPRSAFARAGVVIASNARAADGGLAPDLSHFLLVAQKAGPSGETAKLDGAFLLHAFDVSVLDDAASARIIDGLARIETEFAHLEATLHSLIDWQNALAAAPPQRPAPGLLDRLRRRFGARPALKAADSNSEPAAARFADPELSPAERLALLRLRAIAVSRPAARPNGARPRLAYVSPLPPQRTGIANYSAELLPALAAHYDIDAIVEDATSVSNDVAGVARIGDAALLRAHARDYDRIVYQFGNSRFHEWMIPLLERHPGVVVLHDFFLGHLLAACDQQRPGSWLAELLHSHGQAAARDHSLHRREGGAVMSWPANLSIIRQASGLIVTNGFSRKLAGQFYGNAIGGDWAVIPHLRAAPTSIDRAGARKALGIGADEFVVCAFGYPGPTKCNDVLLDGWRVSRLCDDPRARLAFVGGDDSGGEILAELIAARSGCSRVEITGYVEPPVYASWLAAADAAVQLRRMSRGESSYAIVDCMAYGVPLIANAHGPLAELPDKTALMLPDECTAHELAHALEALHDDPQLRKRLSESALRHVRNDLSPGRIATLYANAIERFSATSPPFSNAATIARVADQLTGSRAQDREWIEEARKLASSVDFETSLPRILLDVTTLAYADQRSGIQRVARAQILALLDDPPQGYRIELVRLAEEGASWDLYQASRYAADLLELEIDLVDAALQPRSGDVYFAPDHAPSAVARAAKAGLYRKLRECGVRIGFEVYDILPITHPRFFPKAAPQMHADWLAAAGSHADFLVCISQDVARQTREWIAANVDERPAGQTIEAIHLGADLEASAPTRGAPPEANEIRGALLSRPTFLAVGTIEPRKGYPQIVAAFDEIWRKGFDANLVIIGAEGWKPVAPDERARIAAIVRKLEKHEERGERLFWLQQASDDFLDELYRKSTCLIAASEAEGFGLPIVEAARRKLPLILRDIGVFREIAGEHAAYFRGDRPEDLAQAIELWWDADARNAAPATDHMPCMTWAENSAKLRTVLLHTDAPPQPQCHKLHGERAT